ncbi:NYN domain-containing protein [Treponema brennaborense]|uniref:NYN domain-containing protein n=1 Tax=Treponema brennaborense (strain DSM 12168 / CIP 105900 / DD5/3) TaxID=906968 RepID=F4LLU1_TREBD|nr:NYN domain-containing protein [Treponema brennaborense]AEE15633.1 protein of unknown function DUF88 [Treponema brennaborense DSM 12168]
MENHVYTAILWDIENVTPPAGTSYIQSIIDTISEAGKISYAMAFGDWNKNNIKNIASELASNSFELIHVPASRKDSADMSMVAHGVELIFQYPHIESYVLITGDADFRPLLLSLRKYGKQTLIICDVKNNASEDLLNMADKYLDYREIIADDDTSVDDSAAGDDKAGSAESKPDRKMTKQQAFELLEEAVSIMSKEKQKTKKPVAIGAVKIRMKLLNADFDERKIGYRNWKSFVNDAVKQTNVRYAGIDEANLALDAAAADRIPEVFAALLGGLPAPGKDATGGWIRFDEASKKFNWRKFGYTRFKSLALDAEKRGFVTIRNSGNTWELKKN